MGVKGLIYLFFVISVDGRLEKELLYTKKALGEGYGGTHELLIQTPNIKGTNILSVQAMKRHLDVLMRVTNISVELFEQWVIYSMTVCLCNQFWISWVIW